MIKEIICKFLIIIVLKRWKFINYKTESIEVKDLVLGKSYDSK